ncbi:hypothetical protein DXG03_001209 [Asterophora parasitica]|uniref:Uncharacterized protein n=1 Tax=Asterophora parasitica TaxID=117018 RepID=A0A9P7K6F2_9AGAR|nr:hypothetical protein DXG03_001209 [Asterophora parasitica]
MARDNYVFCLCCNAEIPRSREREHRQRLNAPYTVPGPAGGPSQQRPITGSDIESDDSDAANTASPSLPATFDKDLPMLEANSPLDEEGNDIEPTEIFTAPEHQHGPSSDVDPDKADLLKQHWHPRAGWTEQWVIIDKSGTLARAVFADDDDEGEE